MTPNSTSSSYCTPDQFLKFYDSRYICQKLLDIGATAEADAVRTGGPLPEASVTQAILDAASGLVESACFVKEIYQPSDLQGLQGNGAQFLARLVADLAMWDLECRRNPSSELSDKVKLAMALLNDLREGTKIFGTLAAAQAGLPEDDFLQQQDVENANLSTWQAKRLFGQRAGWNRC